MSQTVFLELPNATTWSFFSMLLSVALFFKFSRFLSMRNLDVVTLYLLVPGLLLLQEAHRPYKGADAWLWFGYLGLFCGSGYFLVRCLLDLTLVRRPALSPNLNLGGLAWLGGTLAVCLVFVALRQAQGPAETAEVGKKPASVHGVENLVQQQLPNAPARAALALVCHLAVVAGLVVIGRRHFQDLHLGMAAATLYLLLPYTAIHISQYHHVWPSALLVWTVVFYRKPMIAGLLIGLAAGFAFFPAVVFPVWFSFYRGGRGAGRFVAVFLLMAALSLGAHVWWEGGLARSLDAALNVSDWQPWKQSGTEGFWNRVDGTSVHWAYRLPVFIAYLSFLVFTAIWPNPKNLAHVLALTAALLIGVQFWYADQGGVYVLWYLPLLLTLMFRPNLTDRRPAIIQSDDDRLTRALKAVGRGAARWVGLPEPTVRVH